MSAVSLYQGMFIFVYIELAIQLKFISYI